MRIIKVMKWSITSGTILAAAALFCGVVLVSIDAKFNIIRPFPDDYDETSYINEVCADRSILMNQGLVEFARHFVLSPSIRPPGYRLAGFFAGLASEPGPAILRSLSLLSLFVTGLLLFLSGKEISDTNAGIVWASAFAFSMAAVSAALNFGTETTLYPALAGSLYGVARWFRKGRPDAVTLGALALSAALGSLSKLTFFPVFVPLIGAAMLLAPETDRRRRSLLAVLGAIAGGTLVTIPWWLANWRGALWFAKFSSRWSIDSDVPWIINAATHLLGVPFAIGFLVFLCWILVRANSLWKTSSRTTWNFVMVCLAGCLPLVALHIVSANQMMRLLTPALIPGIGVVAVLLDLDGLLKRRVVSAFIALLLVVQTGIIARQIPRMVFQDPWDWGRLREVARAYGLPNPAILLVGLTETFNPPQIQYPWLCHGEALPEPEWPYGRGGFENRPIDWSKLNSLLAQADVVLTAPRSFFESSLDGQNNDELARQLRERSDVWTPVNMYLGLDSKTNILVFFRKHGR
jgi:4-amino-4-deoxy-L-arabinose transferase-like glycosyltransferase